MVRLRSTLEGAGGLTGGEVADIMSSDTLSVGWLIAKGRQLVCSFWNSCRVILSDRISQSGQIGKLLLGVKSRAPELEC